MNRHLPASESAQRLDGVSPTSSPQFSGRWLVVLRSLWLLLAIGLLLNFIAGIPADHAQLQTVCAQNPVQCAVWQLTPGNVQALRRLGLSVHTYAMVVTLGNVVGSLLCLALAALIFWRRSDEWIGLFGSFVLVLLGSYGLSNTVASSLSRVAADIPPTARLLISDVGAGLPWCCLGTFLLIFPTGRFAPR